MCTQTRTRPQQRLFSLGLALLAIGNSAHLLLQRSGRVGEDGVDSITGLLLGAAIGVLILAIYRRNRET